MFHLKNSAFVHLPRSGGTFVRTVVEDQITAFSDHSFDLALIKEAKYTGKKVFGFVRHPISWYESWLSIAQNGTEIVHPAKLDPTLISLGTNTRLEDIIDQLCNPSQKVKDNAFKTALEGQGGRLKIIMLKILNRWRKTENVSFYENICNCYLDHCDYVGKYENIKQELIFMLSSSNDLTEQTKEKIINSGKINFSERTENTILSDAAREIIIYFDRKIIDKYYNNF